MKPSRLLTLLAAALLCAASLHSLPAADVVVDISSFAPLDPNIVLGQIDLNVSIKQYEKARMEHYEARLQLEMGPTETGLTDEQQKQWLDRAEKRFKCLDNAVKLLEARIGSLVKAANDQARQIEKDRGGEKAKPKTAPNQPKADPLG